MRDDQSRACAVLLTMRNAIVTCPVQHDERLASYMIHVGRFLRDDPVAAGAASALVADSDADDAALRARLEATNALGAEHAQQFAAIMRLITVEAKQLLFKDHHVTSGRQPREFLKLLEDIETNGKGALTLAEMAHFKENVLAHMTSNLASFAGSDPQVAQLLGEIKALESSGNEAHRLLEAERIMKRLSLRRLLDRLFAFVGTWEGRLANQGGTGKLAPDGLQHDLPTVIDRVLAKVQEGIAAQYAIHRVRLLFEHFSRNALRDEIGTAEKDASRRPSRATQNGTPRSKRTSAKPQREQILQHHLDEFLFREGYFPVTHSAASGGYTDTLALDRAESAGVPPLLIELKQAVHVTRPSAVKRREVTKAIAVAKGEVARYRGHLAARPLWNGVIPVVIVVHSCREDLTDLNAEGVVVIDLSDRSPSKKTPSKALRSRGSRNANRGATRSSRRANQRPRP